HHMGGLGCADAERQIAKSAMRRGVRIGADEDDARLTETKLWASDMEDALACIAPAESRNFVFVSVAYQQFDHVADFSSGDAGDAPRAGLRIRGNVMVGKRKDLVRMH